MDVTDEELKPLYQWVDEIPLSRPKRNIARDFADGGVRSLRVQGARCRVQGAGCRVQGAGCRVQGFRGQC
jgi:hypothetical protein